MQEAHKDVTEFAHGGAEYATFRPAYPKMLGEKLAQLCQEKNIALDIGCGTGQLAEIISEYFNEVYATDPSSAQINSTSKNSKITYEIGKAEKIERPDNSADLIVAGQAAHWFDLPKFYAEARRVAKEKAIIALISYGVPYIDSPLNSTFQKGYWQDIHKFWPKGREHVEDNYSQLYFPFKTIQTESPNIAKSLTFEQFKGYIKTWTAYENAQRADEVKIFNHFFDQLKQDWTVPQKVIWPISIKAGYILS